MFVGKCGRCAPPRSSVEKSILQKIRLINILQRARIFTDGRSQGLQSHRATLKVHDQSLEDPSVDLVQTILIHLEKIQCKDSYLIGDPSIIFDLRKIPDSLKKTVCKTRGSS